MAGGATFYGVGASLVQGLALKMLRDGAEVIVTTRFPVDSRLRFEAVSVRPPHEAMRVLWNAVAFQVPSCSTSTVDIFEWCLPVSGPVGASSVDVACASRHPGATSRTQSTWMVFVLPR